MASEKYTCTIRLIRSFEHRNIRNLVLKDIDPQCNVGEFKTTVRKAIATSSSIPPPFKKHNYDTLKINSFAHGSKSSDTAIVFDNDEEWILRDDNKTLADYSIRNETEISFFCDVDYRRYKENPQLLW